MSLTSAQTAAQTAARTAAVPAKQLDELLARPPRSLWRDAMHRLLQNKAAVASMVVILLIALVAVAAPVIAPYNPLQLHSGQGFLPPVWVERSATGKTGTTDFLLGTDNLGRDVLSRTLYGARVSMVVGFVPTLIILLIGITVGLVAGYWGGRVDNMLMRVTDIVYAFPDLLFFIIVMTALRNTALGQALNGLLLLFAALAIVNWVGVARLVRGQVLALKEREYVTASHMIGASAARTMFRHILPNALSPIIVSTAFLIPGAIITEAVLGYLGLGLRPATDPSEMFITSWGAMLLDGQSAINNQPWLLIVPAICVATVVLAFNFLGDGLRDALDPNLRE